jgi:hypothetical protein
MRPFGFNLPVFHILIERESPQASQPEGLLIYRIKGASGRPKKRQHTDIKGSFF